LRRFVQCFRRRGVFEKKRDELAWSHIIRSDVLPTMCERLLTRASQGWFDQPGLQDRLQLLKIRE
jgi:hypothetical protein